MKTARLLIVFWMSLLFLGLSPAIGAGADLVISYPVGWAGDVAPPHSASPIGIATVAYKYKDTDPANIFDRSLVVQARNDGTTYTTEFDGKVFSVEYSPDGSRLLVHQIAADDLDSNAVRTYLLDSTGQILWSKVHPSSMFFFSMTGEVVFAWYPGDVNPEDRGRSIEIFGLAGASIREFTFGASDIRGIIVPADSQEVIVVTSRSISRLRAQQPITTVWRLDIPGSYPDISDVYRIDGNRFAVQLDRAVAVVVNVNGTMEYTFDAQALGEADPWLGPSKYAGYRLYAGIAPGEVLFFDGSSGSQKVTLATGTLTKKALNTTSPGPGYVLGPTIVSKRLFFFAKEGARVRTIQ